MSRFRVVLIVRLALALGFFAWVEVSVVVVIASNVDMSRPKVIPKADQVHDLVLAAHPDVQIVPGKNIIWCDTLQLSWNQMIDSLGGKPSFEKQPVLVDKLNAQEYSKDNLHPDEYGIVTGLVQKGVQKQIQEMVKTRFGGKVDELPAPSHLNQDSWVIYSALYTHFSFFPEFQKTAPINFMGKDVQSFGYIKPSKSGFEELDFDEMTLIRYKDDNNFIVHLLGKKPGNAISVVYEVILAKIPPAATLKETMDQVSKENSVAHADNRMTERDELRIPKFNVRLNGSFPELEGLLFKPSTTTHIQPISLDSVSQNIQFKMNEQGVELAASGMIETINGLTDTPPRHLVFDRPFLLLLKHPESAQPFLAIWVDNASLLVAK